jgi:hypothetical protein
MDHLASKLAARGSRADSRRACGALARGRFRDFHDPAPLKELTRLYLSDTWLDRTHGRNARRPYRWSHRADWTRVRVVASAAKGRQSNARARGEPNVLFRVQTSGTGELTKPQQVARLRSQNERLAELLQQEQQTSARLRDDLVSQITSLLTGFTTAQTASLDKAMRGIQTENNKGIVASQDTMSSYSEAAAMAGQRSTQYRKDLEVIRGSHATNREDAGKVCVRVQVAQDAIAYIARARVDRRGHPKRDAGASR